MKKILLAIPYFILWILYFLFTIEKRNEYMVAKSKGYKCIGSKDTSLFIPGSEITYYFDPTQKPERDYVSWSEFWKSKGYFKKTKK